MLPVPQIKEIYLEPQHLSEHQKHLFFSFLRRDYLYCVIIQAWDNKKFKDQLLAQTLPQTQVEAMLIFITTFDREVPISMR